MTQKEICHHERSVVIHKRTKWVEALRRSRILFFFFSWICSTKISRSLHYRSRSLLFLQLRVRSLCSTPPYANSLGYTFFFFSLGKKRKRMGTKKTLFIKHKLTQHFFDRKETLHKETLSLISVRYLFVISRLIKFQNSDFVLKHWNFLTQTSKTTNTRSNMLDLFFYKFFMIFTGSPRRSAPRDDDYLSYVIARKSLIFVAIHLYFANTCVNPGSPRFARNDGINTSTKPNGNFLPVQSREILSLGNPFAFYKNLFRHLITTSFHCLGFASQKTVAHFATAFIRFVFCYFGFARSARLHPTQIRSWWRNKHVH